MSASATAAPLPLFFTQGRGREPGAARNAAARPRAGYGFSRRRNRCRSASASSRRRPALPDRVHERRRADAGGAAGPARGPEPVRGAGGAWRPNTYLPAYVRAYPFIFVEDRASAKVYVGMEPDAACLRRDRRRGATVRGRQAEPGAERGDRVLHQLSATTSPPPASSAAHGGGRAARGGGGDDQLHRRRRHQDPRLQADQAGAARAGRRPDLPRLAQPRLARRHLRAHPLRRPMGAADRAGGARDCRCPSCRCPSWRCRPRVRRRLRPSTDAGSRGKGPVAACAAAVDKRAPGVVVPEHRPRGHDRASKAGERRGHLGRSRCTIARSAMTGGW